MTITLWLRGPARLTLPPAAWRRWTRLTARWATGRLLYDPTRPARVTVTVLQEQS